MRSSSGIRSFRTSIRLHTPPTTPGLRSFTRCITRILSRPRHTITVESTGSGDDMIVAPVTSPVDSSSLLAEKNIWLPAGGWTEWFTGHHLAGPGVFARRYSEDEIPVFVKDGAIIPMQPKMKSTHASPVDPLILTIFPGDSGSCAVYEDEGNSLGYQEGRSATTRVAMHRASPAEYRITILPTEGSYPGMRSTRAYEFRFVNVAAPDSILCNDEVIGNSSQRSGEGWNYDGDLLTLNVRTRLFEVNKAVEVSVKGQELSKDFLMLADGFRQKISRLRRVAGLINQEAWPADWSPDLLIHAEQTGNRISLHPESLRTELLNLKSDLRALPGALDSLRVRQSVLSQVRAHLEDILVK